MNNLLFVREHAPAHFIFFWLGQTCVNGENYVNVLQNYCSTNIIYIYEMSSNYTRCNFVNVTPFLHRKFVGNLTVKKIY